MLSGLLIQELANSSACRAGDEQRSPGRTGIAYVSVPKVAPLPAQSVTAVQVLPPAGAILVSLWQWLGRLPDPRDPRGVRFSLPCVIAVLLAARLAGCDSFTATGEWAASRPQRVLQALGCPRHKTAGVCIAPSEKTIRRVAGRIDHDLADDLLCGWTAELAAAGGILSPAQLQKRRRDKARKARAKARKTARNKRGARELTAKQARKAARRERKAAAAAITASTQAIAGGRAKLPAGSAYGRVPVPATHPEFAAAIYGDPRHVPALRGLGADGKASRGARLNGQEPAPAPGVLLA
jgi:DDE_Tnp_1-associated